MVIKALTVVCSLLFTSISPQEQIDAPAEPHIVETTVSGGGNRIQANPSDSWGHGYFVGRPAGLHTTTSEDAETYLLTIQVEGPNENAGKAVDRIKTANADVYRKFLTLTSDQNYIFEYDHNLPVPFIDMVSRSVVAIYTKEEFRARRNVTSVPRLFRSGSNFKGSLGEGVKRGRIIDVQRIGRLSYSCSFGIENKGADPSGRSSTYFNVLDERFCRHVEDILGLYFVEVHFDQDMVEAWQPSELFAKAILILNSSEADQF